MYTGVFQRNFDVDTLSKLIEPQYKDVDGLSMWIYARFFEQATLRYVEPTYDKPIYSTTEAMLSESVFD